MNNTTCSCCGKVENHKGEMPANWELRLSLILPPRHKQKPLDQKSDKKKTK